MTLAAGTKLGPYEIQSAVGAGGMGEVYRARDDRLGRDVAIKVLPAAFSTDPARLRRFEQEARAAAALSHPNILSVFDIGIGGSGDPATTYIVSELLEGGTLRSRLESTRTASDSARRSSSTGDTKSLGPGVGGEPVARGLALRKAVDYGVQIAHGLAAAHEKGIVHRDLKPENVFITTDGRVKILDFGLAKLTEGGSSLGVSQLATSPPETQPGMLLGTMGYMAPEQVRGAPADHRADIFAFGAVLYEMLSGQRAFQGTTAADTISAILERDPPELGVAERPVPPALARVVDRCLEKSPAARFQSTHDLTFALEGVSAASSPVDVGAPDIAQARPSRRREALAWASAAVMALLAIGAVAVPYVLRSPVDEVAIRFPISLPLDARLPPGPTALSVSPNGRYITFAAIRSGEEAQLWIRSLDSLEARPLSGTAANPAFLNPFWSPDSRAIAFFADGKLKKIDIAGGGPQVLCDAPNAVGGTWSADGVILFGSANSGLSRVSATGGQPTAVTTVGLSDATPTSHRFPFFLPDGKRFLFLAMPGGTLSAGSLDSPEITPLGNADSRAAYASPGHLFFVRQSILFAQPFDVERLSLTGEAVPVAQQVPGNTQTGGASFAAAEHGLLAYRTGGLVDILPSQLKWIDRSGRPLADVGSSAGYFGIELAADERRVAVHPHEPVGGGDLWMLDTSRGTNTRLTFGGHTISAVWSPDGTRIAFGSNRPSTGQPSTDPFAVPFNIFEKRADGTGDMTMLLDSASAKLAPGWKQPTSWSPDGQKLVFEAVDPKTSFDLWVLPLTGDRQPAPLVQTEFQELQGQISPDGKWLAYTSNETRRREVYVRPLSGATGKWQISTTGGVYPRWRRDGNELFYVSADRRLMASETNTSGTAFEAGIPRELFEFRLIGPFWMPEPITFSLWYPYSVSGDGKRFLIAVDAAQQQAAVESPIIVVANWAAELKK